MHTSSTGFNVGLNGVLEFWSNVGTSDQVSSLILAKVSRDWVVMIVLQNPKPEITHIWHIDAVLR